MRETPIALDFTQSVKYFKALSDETRVRILHILSCGELCACDLLEHFSISQPTLSHHLSLLTEVGLVTGRRTGKWMHYSINSVAADQLIGILGRIVLPNDQCECKKIPAKEC